MQASSGAVECAVDPARLARFVESAPRYTSYPPATEFGARFGEPEARSELARLRGDAGAAISLYLHVPFCSSLCWYCGCNVVATRRRERGTAYVDVLADEIALLADAAGAGRKVVELALGGGSPNFLQPADLERLFAAVRRGFRLGAGAEVSVELDPRDTREEQVAALVALGLSRISIGIQDFDPDVQAAIHRLQSAEQTRQLVEAARRLGVERINADLVYGLPRQTPATLARTLDEVIDLAPRRVALFGYAHLPSLRPHQRLVERAGPLPDATGRAALFALAMERLTAAGYRMIGIDHFARPEDELAIAASEGRLHRNFQGYVVRRADVLLGCGATAISDSGGAYWQNEADLDIWQRRIAAGQLPVARGVSLHAEDRLRRQLITRLMCDGAIDFASFESAWPIRFEEHFAAELDRLAGDDYRELVEVDRAERRIAASAAGRMFLRNLCRVFDAYQAADGARGRRFSPSL
ncbi:MAG TPA: oxygen-independent coproporphyrinogen III oxidase [Kofleriaceae bacterium]|nr:oxygen-independent coproporphyrinogen III oxidase [Kofleriaceae bacterium]